MTTPITIATQQSLSKKTIGFSTPNAYPSSPYARRKYVPPAQKRKTERQIGGSEPGDSPGGVSVTNAVESYAEYLITQWLFTETVVLTEMYHAFEVSAEDRRTLLARIPPKHPEVIAHHITHAMVKAGTPLPPHPRHVEVTGYVDAPGLQALTVSVDGQTHAPDGRQYHITHSIDRSMGVKPFHSNKVLKEHPVTRLSTPIPIRVEPKEFQ